MNCPSKRVSENASSTQKIPHQRKAEKENDRCAKDQGKTAPRGKAALAIAIHSL